MQIPPESVLLTWPTPNYVDPAVRGNAVIVMNLVLYPIVLSILVIRVFTRITISKSFGPDDYLIVASLFPATGYAVVALLSELHYNLNRHVWDVEIPDLIMGLKLLIMAQVLFSLAQSLTKLSMLFLTYRIMGSSTGNGRRWARIIMALVIAEELVFMTVIIFQCRPVSAYWTLSVTPQKCINQSLHILIASIINTLTDVLVVSFPIPTVLNLQLRHRQQIIVTLLFAGGYCVCIAGGVRTYFTYSQFSSYDMTWTSYPDWIACSMELYIGLICASVPLTQPFFKKFIPKLLNSTASLRHRTLVKSQQGATDSRSLGIVDAELGDIRYPFPMEPYSQSTKKLGIITETELNGTGGPKNSRFCVVDTMKARDGHWLKTAESMGSMPGETDMQDSVESDDELVKKTGRLENKRF